MKSKTPSIIRVPIPPFWNGVNASCAFDHLLPSKEHCPSPGFIPERAMGLRELFGFGLKSKIQMIRATSYDTSGDSKSMFSLVRRGLADVISRPKPVTLDRVGRNVSYAFMTRQDHIVYIYKTIADSRPSLSVLELAYEPRAYWFLMSILLGTYLTVRSCVTARRSAALPRPKTPTISESQLLWLRKFYESFRIIFGLIFAILLSAMGSYLFSVFTKHRPKMEPFHTITDLRDRISAGEYRLVTTDAAFYYGLIEPDPQFIRTQIQKDFATIKARDPDSSLLTVGGWLSVAQKYLLESNSAAGKSWVMVAPNDAEAQMLSGLCGLTITRDELGFNFGASAIFWNSHFPVPKLTRNQIDIYHTLADRLTVKHFPPRLDCPPSAADVEARMFNAHLIIKFYQLQGVFVLLSALLGLCILWFFGEIMKSRSKPKIADSTTSTSTNKYCQKTPPENKVNALTTVLLKNQKVHYYNQTC